MFDRLLFLAAVTSAVTAADLSKYFGTKTPYRAPNTTEEAPPMPSTCRLLNVNLVARHGSRFPTMSTIESFSRLSELCEGVPMRKRPPWMADGWKCPYPTEMAGHLCERGEVELFGIGERLSRRYSEVLGASLYNPSFVSIECTKKPRTSASATAFALAMLSGGGSLGVARMRTFAVLTAGKTLRPFDICEYYDGCVKEGPETVEQQRKYSHKALKKVAKRVAKRIGFDTDDIGVEEVWAMWNACHYDVVVLNKTNEWCSAFDEEDAQSLEFSEDLLSYWKKGRGNVVSFRVMTPLLEDISQNIEAVLAGDTGSKQFFRAKLRFAHAETLLPLLALLGINTEPEAPSAGWSPEQIRSRLWRDSAMSPFSANLALGTYDCGWMEGIVVQPILNERSVRIPGCTAYGGTVCTISEFRSIVSEGLSGESWDDMCSLKPCDPNKAKKGKSMVKESSKDD